MSENRFQLPSRVKPLIFDHASPSYSIWIKRDDEIHPDISGNKYRKLIPNIDHVKRHGFKGIITFGGAFSNHIHAMAAAGEFFDISTVGIIRGDQESQANPTLQFAITRGMKIHFVSRAEYKDKEGAPSIANIIASYPQYLLVPEGGSNELGICGAATLMDEILEQGHSPDAIFLAAGSGASAAGLLRRIHELNLPIQLYVIPVLKGEFMEQTILDLAGFTSSTRLSVMYDFHHGGYGKVTAELIQFINDFYESHQIPLDPIYNGKAMFALLKMLKNNQISQPSNIVYIHTGGLQGIEGYRFRNSGPAINFR